MNELHRQCWTDYDGHQSCEAIRVAALRWLLRRNRPIRVMKPIRIADDLQGLAGMWVAVKDGKVVEAGRTPDAVGMKLRARQVKGATILRVPAEGEPELVGIG